MKNQIYKRNLTMFGDLYAWTMAQSWFDKEMHLDQANYVMYFRKLPKNYGYLVFSGIEDILNFVEKLDLKFASKELRKLEVLGGPTFSEEFHTFLENYDLKDINLKIHSVEEGEIIFPYTPIISFEGPLFLLQILEAYSTNTVDYQSRVATKAARISQSLNWIKNWAEFGARRSSGVDGSISAAKASIIGGASGTSNVEAAILFDIKPSGTVGHSFIMSFENEINAFESYTNSFPKMPVMLIDTYDIGESLNSIVKVNTKLKKQNSFIHAVRIDSGDLLKTSILVREFLDDSDMKNTKIIVSGELDEYEIEKLESANAPIDLYGVGNKLNNLEQVGFVFKLTALKRIGKWENILKSSKTEKEKATLMGRIRAQRFLDKNNKYMFDVTFENSLQQKIDLVLYPSLENERFDSTSLKTKDIQKLVHDSGKNFMKEKTLYEIQIELKENINNLDQSIRKLIDPKGYKYGLEKEYFKKWKSKIDQ